MGDIERSPNLVVPVCFDVLRQFALDPGGVPELRFVSGRIDRELVDSLDRRRIRRDRVRVQRAARIGRNAVERGAICRSLPSADTETCGAAQVFRIGRDRGQVERRADASGHLQGQVLNQSVLKRCAVLRFFGLQLGTVYSPCELLTVSTVTLVASLVILMEAPGTTAPEVSRTAPVILPRSD